MENTAIKKLVAAVRSYLRLQRDYMLLTLAEKLTVLFTAVAMAMVLVVLAALILVFLSIAAGAALGAFLGSTTLGYLIVALVYILLGVVVFIFRRQLFITPIATFLATLFLDDKQDGRASGGPINDDRSATGNRYD